MEKVAIIIVNKNESRFLIDLILKFYGQRTGPEVDFIFVDGGSSDNSVELAKNCGGVRIIENTERPGPFGAFVSGCKATDAKIVSCWSMDDLPVLDYLVEMSLAMESYPMVDIVTCNCEVEREGKIYHRTLLPFNAYISPDYAVKMFKAGYSKSFNLIGQFVRKRLILECWENGGKDLDVNFDGMFFFYSMFQKGIVNIGRPLVRYRSYPNSFGGKSCGNKAREALAIHAEFYKKNPVVYARTIASGVWSIRNQAVAQFAVRWIMRMPKFLRCMVYRWLYSYSWRVEKL